MRRCLVLIACLTVALGASPADAKKKHKKKPVKLGPVVTVSATGNTATTASPESTATATCPPGKQAVGGGFTASVNIASALVVHDSYQSAANAWTVAAQQANGEGAVTAHVYCRNAKPPVIATVAAANLSSSGEVKTLAASCPGGTRLIGGGFRSTVPLAEDAVVFPEVNQATSATTWTVTGVENQDGAITLSAYAYCMAKIRPPTIVSQTISADAPQLAPLSTTTPSCPTPPKPKKGKKKHKKKPRKLLSAGGFASTVFAPGSPEIVFGESHVDTAGGWLAIGVNAINTPGSVSVTSQAICL
jgi:hypothetical protein